MSVLHKFAGASGSLHNFGMIGPYERFKQHQGVYLFGALLRNGTFNVLYVGKSKNLADRPSPNHEKFDAALRLGMSHVGGSLCYSEGECDQIEQDLIRKFCPPLNQQHNVLAGLLR